MFYSNCEVFLLKQDRNISLLLDFYGELLTEKQKNALELCYNMDFSLAEIAENIGVTRQCVRDFIKKGEAHLISFEEKAGLCRKFEAVNAETEKIMFAVNLLSGKSEEELLKAEAVIKKSVSAINDIMEF